MLGQGLSSMLMERPTQAGSDVESLRRPMNLQSQQMHPNVGYVGSPSQKVNYIFLFFSIFVCKLKSFFLVSCKQSSH